MTRRSGLGKGLSSLIPPAEAVDQPDQPSYVEVPIDEVVPNPFQPRVHFDEDTLGELAASIAELGVLQPILVRRVDDRYQLIAGERRWRAARRAGLTTVPAVRAHVRRRQRRRAGARREPPPRGPHPARGGGRVLAADRGLRADPRRGRPARRQEPLGGDQHAAPARPAARGAAPARRRQAVGRARPGAARHARPGAAGAAGPPGRRRGVVGAHGRGGHPRRRHAGAGRAGDAGAPAGRRRRPDARPRGCARPACSSWSNCSPTPWTRGWACRWAPSGAR